MKQITVAVIYNTYFEREEALDYIAEEDVFAACNFVESALADLKCNSVRIPLDNDINKFIERIRDNDFQLVFNLAESFLGKSACMQRNAN